MPGPGGKPAPYDRRRFYRHAEPALAALENCGYDEFTIGIWVDDERIETALKTLGELGCIMGLSHDLPLGEVARIHLTSGVGGWVDASLVTRAVEREATDHGNREKLREPADAQRRHLFVVIDASTGPAWSAINRDIVAPLPVLPEPITTAWVSGGNVVLVTSPEEWQQYIIPNEVFTNPERWIDL